MRYNAHEAGYFAGLIIIGSSSPQYKINKTNAHTINISTEYIQKNHDSEACANIHNQKADKPLFILCPVFICFISYIVASITHIQKVADCCIFCCSTFLFLFSLFPHTLFITGISVRIKELNNFSVVSNICINKLNDSFIV